METRDVQAQILRLLEKNERSIGQFYRECAERFPAHAQMWRVLATEEDTHALMIGVMRSLVEEGLDLGHRPSWSQVARLAEEVRTRVDSLRGQTLTMEYAVICADALERLFAESEALRVYDGDPPELANLLRHLAEDSLRHARSIGELAAAFGPTSGAAHSSGDGGLAETAS